MTYALYADMTLARSLEDTFALFGDASNLETLTPPELRFEIRTAMPIEMRAGTRIEYRIRLFGIPFSWWTEITCWEPGRRFVDEQSQVPFTNGFMSIDSNLSATDRHASATKFIMRFHSSRSAEWHIP